MATHHTLALDDFLGHETKSSTNSQFLRGWKKRSPPKLDIFLHRKAPIIALWQCNVPRIYEKDLDDGTKQRRVFGGSWNCLESEDVLRKQYRRDKDTGERAVPPVIDPICRMMEHVRELYSEGELSFTEALFRWEGDDPQETQTITLGGMLNMYGSDKLSAEQKAEMARAGVKGSEAWKENMHAKCNYVFTVVDVDDPESGVQIAVETTSLGDHAKECIRNQMTSLGEDEGNPILNPYALRFEHHPNAKEFNKKYKVIAMPRIELTPEIEALINSEAPNIDRVVKPGNVTTLRADLEAHYIGPKKLDWDWIFGPAERAGFGDSGEDAEVDDNEPKKTRKVNAKADPEPQSDAEAQEPAPKSEPKAKTGGRRKKKAEAKPEPERIACDECGHMMLPTEAVCEKCGAEYEIDEPAAAAPTEEAPKKKGVNF